jgi:hypothetical protein
MSKVPTLVEMTYSDWFEKFSPVKNHLVKDSAFDGRMFETFGQEVEFIGFANKVTPRQIWTLVDGDDGWVIVEGAHFVNRLGYFVTKRPHKANTQYNINPDVS